MEQRTTKKKWSIKRKLIIIGSLFMASLLLPEILQSYSNVKIERARAEALNRQEQLDLLDHFKTSLLEINLVAMDAVVDKESGTIDSELLEEMRKANLFWRDNIGYLNKIADTSEEQRLVREVAAAYPVLENLVMQELPSLISSHAEEAAFKQIDDKIDGQKNTLGNYLTTIMGSVEEEDRIAFENLEEQIRVTTTIKRAFTFLMLVVLGGSLFFIGRSILVPITAASNMVKDVAEGEGDLTKRLTVGSDEIGELAGWFNVFMEKLHGIVGQIHETLTILNNSSKQMVSLSHSLAVGSNDASTRSGTVASAAEQMSANMNGVAAASEQASTNVTMIASAVEEMNATVNEIAGNTSKARTITEGTVTKTSHASQRVAKLGAAANEISKVTEVITEISEQTNLLALNATIEAARAGEAGKGFAVVANEIKELAKQTAQATQEIRQKIEAIQSSTNMTVTEISEINTTINDINEIVTTIASAVEEQSASTSEIADNVSQAAQGIAEVNANVSQCSAAAADISKEIAGINTVAEQLKIDSDTVEKQAEERSALAERLNNIVNQFKL